MAKRKPGKRGAAGAKAPGAVQALISQSAPRAVRIPNDPPERAASLLVRRTWQTTLRPILSDKSFIEITPAVIMTAVPGGSSFWSQVRIHKVMFWSQNLSSGSASSMVTGGSGTLRIVVPAHTDWGQPIAEFRDSGVAGASRPRIGVELGVLQRMRFWNPADTTLLFTVYLDKAREDGGSMTAQFDLELMSTVVPV